MHGESGRALSACTIARACSLAALVALGCSSVDGGENRAARDDDACASAAAVQFGAERETYLGLSDATIRALVHVVDRDDVSGNSCTGVFIAPEWVLTAGHCVSPELASQVHVSGRHEAATTLPVEGIIVHEHTDLALLNVPSARGLSVVPLSVATELNLTSGMLVELAGYGLTETGASGRLRFVVEAVAGADASTIRVSGFGRSGLCHGDSGGPLLVRAADGRPTVAGVLWIGSASCVGTDIYLRVDPFIDWIRSHLEPEEPEALECGTIDAEGRCLYGSALWCEGGLLTAQHCGAREQCAWDRRALGYRCTTRPAESCAGVDAFGACDGDSAIHCQAGALQRSECPSCQTCVHHPTSGRATCL